MPNPLNGKKILVLLAGFLAKDARVLRHVRYFSSLGLAVTVLSFDSKPDSNLSSMDGVTGITWPGFRNAKGTAKNWVLPKKVLFYLAKLISIFTFNLLAYLKLGNQRFDFYLANDFDTLPLASWLARRSGGRLIYDSHELYAEQRPETPKFYVRIIHAWEKQLSRHADCILTVNASIARTLSQRYLLKTPPRVVFNVPERPVSFLPKDKISRSLLYHGTFMRDRGLPELVSAIADVPDVTLLLRGSGELEEELKGLVNQLGISSRVSFEPPVAVDAVIPEASRFEIGIVFLSPNSLNNQLGLPNKIFEYMHAGLAVLSNDVPELKSMIEKEDIGVCIPKIEKDSIAQTIRHLLSNPGRLRQYQENARRAAQEKYHFEHEKVKWLQILEGASTDSVLSQRNPTCAAL